MATQWRYASPEELRDLIKSAKTPGTDYVVVDVRDDDFAGGNIPGCVRAPFRQFEAALARLVRELADVPAVVFHCTMSQVRGPKAARMYAETRGAAAGEPRKQDVLVLRGGFAAFQAAYKDDAELVEKWDESVWGDDAF